MLNLHILYVSRNIKLENEKWRNPKFQYKKQTVLTFILVTGFLKLNIFEKMKSNKFYQVNKTKQLCII